MGPASLSPTVTERSNRAVNIAPVTAISMGTNRSSPVWVNSMISTMAQSGARWVVARTAAAPMIANAAVGAPGHSKSQRFPVNAPSRAPVATAGVSSPPLAPLPRHENQQSAQGAQAQRAVEGELRWSFSIAQ